ncbi:MAG TPA: ubiquinone/menaquinone biosynthesis methyltransferase [Fimbriiglobus sp.]
MSDRLTLKRLDREQFLRDPNRKQHYVNAVFEIVASSYDRFTRYGSFGFDPEWKRDLVRLAKRHLKPDHIVIDLATGTGDLAFALAPYVRDGRILGLDLAHGMIEIAESRRQRRHLPHVSFRLGDLTKTQLPDGCADLVTVGYGLRNCPDFRLGLRETYRILKPGGFLANLDFVRLDHPLAQLLFHKALLLSCNAFGWLWHREAAAYGYLAHSVRTYATNREFVDALHAAGFRVDADRSKLFGVVHLHLAQKK